MDSITSNISSCEPTNSSDDSLVQLLVYGAAGKISSFAHPPTLTIKPFSYEALSNILEEATKIIQEDVLFVPSIGVDDLATMVQYPIQGGRHEAPRQ